MPRKNGTPRTFSGLVSKLGGTVAWFLFNGYFVDLREQIAEASCQMRKDLTTHQEEEFRWFNTKLAHIEERVRDLKSNNTSEHGQIVDLVHKNRDELISHMKYHVEAKGDP